MSNEYYNKGLSEINDQIGYFKAYEILLSTNPSENQRIDFLSEISKEFLTRNRLPVMSLDDLQYEIMDKFHSDIDDDLKDFLGFEITEDEKNTICGWIDKFSELWDDDLKTHLGLIGINTKDPFYHTLNSQVYYYENHGIGTYKEMMGMSLESFKAFVTDTLGNDYLVNKDDQDQIIKNFIKWS